MQLEKSGTGAVSRYTIESQNVCSQNAHRKPRRIAKLNYYAR